MRQRVWSTCERSTPGQSMRERSTRRFSGDGGGWGFQSAGMRCGFGGYLFLFRSFPPRDLLLGDLLSVVLVNKPSSGGTGFAKWRHSAILLYTLRTSIVSGQRLDQIEIVALQKFAQITASAPGIGFWLVGDTSPPHS